LSGHGHPDEARAVAGIVSSLDLAAEWGHEEVVVVQDAASGLRGVVARHDTRRGPAIAATRLRPDASLEEALAEALRLSRAMTLESAAADISYGGGAAVLVGPAARTKDRALLSAYARVLERMGGQMLAAPDLGFEERDLTVLGRMTRHVAHKAGPGDGVADLTALALLECVRETAHELGRALEEVHVAVQGVGQIGYRLARLLRAHGVRLTVADSDPTRRERAQYELSALTIGADEIYDVEADIFSPNAGSGVLNADTIPRLRCRAVVGGARDVLADAQRAERLHERGVLYAPDFVTAGGGLSAALGPGALDGGDDENREMAAKERVAAVGDRLGDIFRQAREDGVSPLRAAQRLVDSHLPPRPGVTE
jgi:leucine dehydrogenase